MIRIVTLTALLISTSLLLLSCFSGNSTSPVSTPTLPGVAFTIPPYDILRHGFDLEGVWANETGSITVGEMGMAFLSTADGRYWLPAGSDYQPHLHLTDVCAVPDGTIIITSKDEDSATNAVMWYKDGRRQFETGGGAIGYGAVASSSSGIGGYPVYAIVGPHVHRFKEKWEFLGTSALGDNYDIWAHDFNSIWVAGQGGIQYGNSEGVFTKYIDDFGSHYDGISGVAVDSVMAVGGRLGVERILMFTGDEFNPVYNSPERLSDICWVEQDFAIAVGAEGATVEYDGSNWIPRHVDPPIQLWAVAAWKESDQRRAIAVGDSGGVFTFSDGQWTGASSPKITCTELMGVSPSLMFALHDGRLMKYDGDWHELPAAGTLVLHDFFCLDQDTVWAVGKQDIDTFFARYDGTSWYTQWISSMEDAHDIWAADNRNVFIACDYGTVYSSAGFWAPMTAVQPVQHLRGVWGESPTSVYVVGDNGTISHWDGSIWTQMTSGTSSNLLAVWGSSDQNVVAVGDDGTVLRFDGNSWIDLASGLPSDNNPMVWCDGSANIWVCTSNGNVAHYDGAGWERRDTQLSRFQHTGMWGQGEDLFILSEHDLLLRYQQPPAGVAKISLW